MKITHNKVGQNLNMVDGVKQEKTSAAGGVKNGGGVAKELDAKAGALAGAGATKVDLSDRALEAKRIKELATAAPDIDMEKVEKFRKLIDEGKYKVDAQAVADKMVDDHMELKN